MKISDIGLAAIKQFEGCQLKAYKCPAGVWTIGYGSTRNVYAGLVITYPEAEKRLRNDLAVHETFVNKLGVCKTQGQFDALVSFSFNLGDGNLKASTLLKFIKAGKPTADIQAQFMRWNHVGKKVLAGLTKRRAWEAKRWAEK